MLDEVAPLTVAAVARRLGVTPSTLRTWERRYGVGPADRETGTRRRYSALDVARLEHMRRLTLDGVPPADAARLALGGAPDSGRMAAVPFTNSPRLALVPDTPPRSGPGGRVVGVPEAAARARGLARAAQGLDVPAVRQILSAAVDELGVITTWELLLAPVLRGVGERWAATGEGVEVEHLLAECASGVLRAMSDGVVATRNRPILLACPDNESHCLPLHALGAALGERGVATRCLGAAVPPDAIVAAVRRTGPAVLFLYAQQPVLAPAGAFHGLPATRPPTALLAGGAGWDPARLPRGVTYAHDLAEAVHLVQLACGVG